MRRRSAGTPRRADPDIGVGQIEELTLHGDGLIPPRVPEDFESLVEAPPPVVGNIELFVFRFGACTNADTDAEGEAAAADLVDRRRLMGDVDRMPKLRQIDRRTEGDGLRRTRNRCQRRKGLKPWFRQHAVADPDAVEADRLGPTSETDHFRLDAGSLVE